MIKTELLSPAGDMRSAEQAVQNGADAVYLAGKSFGARAFADNFSYKEMKEAIDYAHTYGVKVYIAANTLIYEQETDSYLNHIKKIYEMGADAVIMQDVGMIRLVHHCFPDIDIHASTQMHNHNDAALSFAAAVGAKRAILAREMDIDQIKSLSSGIEKEVFVHGALCICYSGQCLMSALTMDRSGNRGQCAQVCRMRFQLIDENGQQIKTGGRYILSPKDLALFDDINMLIDAGIYCFKIEGRMKSPEYVGCATGIYADILRQIKENKQPDPGTEKIDHLRRLFNRGFTRGHLFNEKGKDLMGAVRPNHRGVPLGRVLSVSRDRICIALDAPLVQGDGIKFEESDTGFICNKIYQNDRLVHSVKAGETAEVDNKARVRTGEAIVKTSDVLLIKELDKIKEKRKVPINARMSARKGEALSLSLEDELGHRVRAIGDIAQQSVTSPMTKADIGVSISKMGGSPYKLRQIDIECDDDIFIPKSVINELRRRAVSLLTEERISFPPRRIQTFTAKPAKMYEPAAKAILHVLVRNEEQFQAVKNIVDGDIYTGDKSLYLKHKDVTGQLRLKTDRLEKAATPYKNERLLVTDHGAMHACQGKNDVVADYTLNILNSYTLNYYSSLSVGRFALSPELNIEQTTAMMREFRRANGFDPAIEALIHARHELMVLKHCVITGSGKKDCGVCRKKSYLIEDVNGRRFPIVTDENCNNYILNCAALKPDINRLYGIGIRHFRIELFDEDAAGSKFLIEKYIRMIKGCETR